eukprot:gene18930-biopygen2463
MPVRLRCGPFCQKSRANVSESANPTKYRHAPPSGGPGAGKKGRSTVVFHVRGPLDCVCSCQMAARLRFSALDGRSTAVAPVRRPLDRTHEILITRLQVPGSAGGVQLPPPPRPADDTDPCRNTPAPRPRCRRSRGRDVVRRHAGRC